MIHRYKFRMKGLNDPVHIISTPQDVATIINNALTSEVYIDVQSKGPSEKFIIVESQAGAGSNYELFTDTINIIPILNHITSLIKEGTPYFIYEVRVVEHLDYYPQLTLKPKKGE